MMSSVLMLSALLAIANLTSCKTQEAYVLPSVYSAQRDTLIQHDSIYVREFVQGDTVFVTKFQDRWRDRVVNRCDTVYVQPTIPPDKPIPRFYKDCTAGFWILLIILVGIIALRCMKAKFLRRLN